MSRSERKWDHIRYALTNENKCSACFEDIQFIHQSLPNISMDDIRLDYSIGELSLSSPIFINAMTGGGGDRTYRINRDLAKVANTTGLAMAVGSQMSAIKDKNEQYTYQVVRKENPNGIIIANLGSEATPDNAKLAIDMIEANALQIHLNVIQELTMPEGDRNFTNALKRIEAIVKNVHIPVIVKEVGFGMSQETVAALASIGVSMIDIGGVGGTNFAQIENRRRENAFAFFNEWGIPTAISILEASNISSSISIIGSGGITSSIEIAKAIAIGASGVGIAGVFLKKLMKEGTEGLILDIESIHQELRFIMAALGIKNISDIKNVPLIISGKTYHWLTQRGVDTTKYSKRR